MHYDMDDYQVEAEMFAVYPEVATGSDKELSYLTLGLVGEAGEVAEKIKKKIRDGKFDKHETAKELGDVLWYLANLAAALDYSLAGIAYDNIKKLTDRKQRNVIQGSGDNR
jgi:NTP pyrophosphatase (non-canonical NTP hydrolase)